MRRTLAASLLIAAASLAAGCGRDRVEDAGPKVTRSFPVGDFAKLEVAGSYDVSVRTGGKPGVSVTGPERIVDQLVVEVEGDELQIHPKKDGLFGGGIRWRSHDKVTVAVTVPQLTAATIAGSGDVSVDKIGGNSFDGSIAGSGSLTLPSVNVKSLTLDIAGSGGVNAGGKAAKGKISIAGSGSVDAAALDYGDVDISIAGSGDVSARATGNAVIDLMGSGDVRLTGGAKCKVSKMGSGNANCS